MSVKSIKLKLKTRSGTNSLSLRKGLWKTHELMNQGIAYYMEWLTLLRQEPVGSRSKEELRQELIGRLQEQRKRNGYSDSATELPDEVFLLLRELYECIVPSSVGESGDAQLLSRKYLSPLTDPDSEGGEGKSKAGRKPGWLLKKEAGDPTWEAEFLRAQKRKEADPTPRIMQALREFGIKPLFPLFTNLQSDITWLPPANKKQFVRTWDRDMFQQAIEKLLSWESWNRRVKDEREKLEQRKAKFEQEYLQDADGWLAPLQQFEKDREKELAEVAFAPGSVYLITPRQIRGWEKLYEKWEKLNTTTEADYIARIAEVQSSMPKEFGDPVVFRFLAKAENHHIWKGHKDRLFLLASYNQIKKQLQQAKEQAAFTLPDPVEHPLWIRFDARDGNLHDYVLWQESKRTRSRRTVTFSSLIMPSENGWCEQANVEVELALSRQFYRQIELCDNPKGKQEITFKDYSSGIPLKGHLGGAKIQFDRCHLEKNRDTLAEGNVGPVYLNVTVDIQPSQEIKNGRLQSPLGQALKVLAKDWPKVTEYKPSELESWILQSGQLQQTGIQSLTSGMRVMTVDMGIRTSAAVSIFEAVKEPPANSKKLCYKLPHCELYAVHRRSFLLNMPGERPDRRVKEQREKRTAERYAIRSQIRLLAQVNRLYAKETVFEQKQAIDEMVDAIQRNKNLAESVRNTWVKELGRLSACAGYQQDVWEKEVSEVYKRLEYITGEIVGKWRRSFGKGRKNLAGLSLWNIEELDSLRKLLISWSKRSRRPGEVNRLQENEKFAVELLEHIRQVKDNRLKQMANLIVMTALGYVYDETQREWIEKYPACQLILFENLQRYRFKQDRSRKENSQLMKWAHRSIPKTVWMQGEPFGLQVGDVNSEFSSRFHAKTGAPGIRCHMLTEPETRDSFLKEMIVKKGFLNEQEVELLKAGDIIPMQGGELFVTLKEKAGEELLIVHADINAAQNLQRRFWHQNAEVFRVVCQAGKTAKGEEVYIPKYKLAEKHLGKGLFRKQSETEDEHVYIWDNKAKIKGKTLSDDSLELEDEDEGLESLEEAKEARGEYKTLFRDPSGFFFPQDTWRPQVEFWSIVKSRLEKRLKMMILQKR